MRPPDFGTLRALSQSMAKEVEQLQRDLGEMQRDLKAVTATARSADGYVKVTVGFRGQVTAVELDPRIYRQPDSKALAAAIVETIQKAGGEAARRVDEVSARYGRSLDLRSIVDGDLATRLSRFDTLVGELDRWDD